MTHFSAIFWFQGHITHFPDHLPENPHNTCNDQLFSSTFPKLGKILSFGREMYRFGAKLVDEKYIKILKLQIGYYILIMLNDTHYNFFLF